MTEASKLGSMLLAPPLLPEKEAYEEAGEEEEAAPEIIGPALNRLLFSVAR